MNSFVSDIAFTEAVKTQQERLGSRANYAKMEQHGGWSDTISEGLRSFIGDRDSLYLATATSNGRPYIQHRGGAPGFLKVLDAKTLALADFRGNRQYVSMGNLSENDQAFIFLMDYPNKQRIKIWGRAEFVEGDKELLARVVDREYPGKAQRVLRFHVEAWDANCPQHIVPRFTAAQIADRESALQRQITALSTENADLWARLAATSDVVEP